MRADQSAAVVERDVRTVVPQHAFRQRSASVSHLVRAILHGHFLSSPFPTLEACQHLPVPVQHMRLVNQIIHPSENARPDAKGDG